MTASKAGPVGSIQEAWTDLAPTMDVPWVCCNLHQRCSPTKLAVAPHHAARSQVSDHFSEPHRASAMSARVTPEAGTLMTARVYLSGAISN